MSSNRQNTIFLTPEEAERMRSTFKERLQKCSELAGKPQEPRDEKSLRGQVTSASLMSDMALASLTGQPSQSDSVKAYSVGQPYPPCTIYLADLEPMKISELTINVHHRGRVLHVKRGGPVVTLVTCSWTFVKDEATGETERLEMMLHKTMYGEDVLESGSKFTIKEPYFTINDEGEPTIRIDHPSDLFVTIEESENRGSNEWDAKKFKEEGNAALKKKDLTLAREMYTRGLSLVEKITEEEIMFDLHRNRAHVNLSLNRYDDAKTDALAAVTDIEDDRHRELDSKAYFRAGSAAYSLGDYEEAKELFEREQKLAPDNKEAGIRVRRTKLRLQEQSTGDYKFNKLRAAVSLARPRVDAASFTRNVEVKASKPGSGRGLFAKCHIKSGEIVICEKPFCVVWGHEEESLTAMTYDFRDDKIRASPAGLPKAIVQKLSCNPSQIGKVMDLYGDYEGLGKRIISLDGCAVVDTFQVHDIVARNAFGPGPIAVGPGEQQNNSNGASAGLWVVAAYTNHSCIPNTKKEAVGDLMILRATTDIKPGDEITHSYDSSSDFDARSAALMNTWGFICSCKLCAVEKEDSLDVRKKRRDLGTQASNFVQRESPVRPSRLVSMRARRLAKSIEETYDEKRYKGLPRLALVDIQEWLADAPTS